MSREPAEVYREEINRRNRLVYRIRKGGNVREYNKLPESMANATPQEKKREYQNRYYEKYGDTEAYKTKKSINAKAYYQAHREERLAYLKAYYEAHKDELSAYKKAYTASHREQSRERQKKYYWAHREEMLAKNKAYREAHREEINARHRARYHVKKNERIQMNIKALENASELMQVEDVAELLGCTNITVYNLIKRGELPAAKIGKRWYIKKSELLAKFDANG